MGDVYAFASAARSKINGIRTVSAARAAAGVIFFFF